MKSDDDKMWERVAGELRRKKGLCPPTPDEAEAQFDAAPAVPLTRDEIRLIIDAVLSGKVSPPEPVPDEDCEPDPAIAEIGEQALALFRNEGEADPEIEKAQQDLENELLDDDESEEDEA
jgi:hypothetical protein